MKYIRLIISILVLLISLSLLGCGNNNIVQDEENNGIEENNEKIVVAVSIVPEETFVKAVAGDLVDVVTLIPPGNSPANYQPSPKEIAKFSDSKVYFSIGVPTEEANILPKVADFSKDIKVINLANIVGEVYPHRFLDAQEHEEDTNHENANHEEHDHGDADHEEHNHEVADHEEHDHEDVDHEEESHHHHEGRDPHIWLSPKRVKIIVETIKNELIILDPENKDTYEENASNYIKELDAVDLEIKDTLSHIEDKSFIIHHPSYGYFADDYGLTMVAIEEDGKSATAKRIIEIIDYAKENDIRFIFYQEEFDNQQAETIAKEINGVTIKVAPLSPNYIDNLKYMSSKLKEY
ncbi:MAG: zinc ABC transporter substrate-binding protein [Firmicutes bacterium]|jgi:zinc transport system substrate-binding protein|nr:zinc ABC transporter substrate-binding protein [Bacillota bacterium]